MYDTIDGCPQPKEALWCLDVIVIGKPADNIPETQHNGDEQDQHPKQDSFGPPPSRPIRWLRKESREVRRIKLPPALRAAMRGGLSPQVIAALTAVDLSGHIAVRIQHRCIIVPASPARKRCWDGSRVEGFKSSRVQEFKSDAIHSCPRRATKNHEEAFPKRQRTKNISRKVAKTQRIRASWRLGGLCVRYRCGLGWRKELEPQRPQRPT